MSCFKNIEDAMISGHTFYSSLGDRVFDKSSKSNNTSLVDNMIISDTPIKSVFKFDEYNRNYEIRIIKNLIVDKRRIDKYIVCDIDGEAVDHKHEYDIYLPFLKVGEEFYLEDIDIIVTIKNIMRTSNNKVIYTCNDKINISDEAKSKRIKLLCECSEENDKLLKQYKENSNIEDCISKEPEKKKGFFTRLFSR